MKIDLSETPVAKAMHNVATMETPFNKIAENAAKTLKETNTQMNEALKVTLPARNFMDTMEGVTNMTKNFGNQ